MTALRELFAEFFTSFDPEGNLARGDKQVDSLASHIVGFGKTIAGAFALHEVVDGIREIINEADALRDKANKLRVPAAWLEGWSHAADLAGSSGAAFDSAFTKFNKGVAEAKETGKGPLAEAAAALGIAAEDVKNKLPADLFDQFVAGFASVEDPAKRVGIAIKAFGKAGADMLPLINEGPAALAEMRGEVEALGAGMEQGFLDQADEFNDNISRLKLGLRGLAIQALAPLLPGMVDLVRGGVSVIKNIVSWVRHTKVIEAAILGFKAKALVALLRTIPVLIAKIGGWGAALRRLGSFALRTLLPFLLLEDAIVFLSGGKSAIGRNLDRIFGKGTQQKVRAFIQAIQDFLGMFVTAPDKVREAFAELPKDMEAALGAFGSFLGGWAQTFVDVILAAVSFVTDVFAGRWDVVGAKLNAVWESIKLGGVAAWTEVKFAGLAAAAALSDAWDSAVGFILGKLGAVQSGLGKLLSFVPGFEDLGKELEQSGAENKQAGAREPTAGQEVDQQWNAARLRIVADMDGIKAAVTRAVDAAGNPTSLGGTDLGEQGTGRRVVEGAIPPKPVTNITQDVRQQNTVNNTINVAAGTPDEQQRELAGAATRGTKAGVNTNQLRAALVPTPG